VQGPLAVQVHQVVQGQQAVQGQQVVQVLLELLVWMVILGVLLLNMNMTQITIKHLILVQVNLKYL